jgi:hypothetical protein
MVLNLIILKILAFLPGLSCVKKAFPLLSISRAKVITINTGHRKTIPSKDNILSISVLK